MKKKKASKFLELVFKISVFTTALSMALSLDHHYFKILFSVLHSEFSLFFVYSQFCME